MPSGTPSSRSPMAGLAVLLVADIALHAWGIVQARPSAQSVRSDPNIPAFVQIAERLQRSVVNVSKQSSTRGPGGGTGVDSLGSGVILTSDGYIATNAHVIGQSESVIVRLPSRDEYIAAVAQKDTGADVALLKIDPKARLTAATMPAPGSVVRVGEWVLAIGNPFALDQTVTAGIVSATGRVIGSGPYDTFLQTDAAINAGNSGGPLVNLKGEVVGLSAAAAGGIAVPGIGFAVPIDAVRRVLDAARAGR